ncbi:MAG: TatD family hydrolase [Bradymonadia bacterium]
MYTLPGFKGNAVSYIDAHCHIDFEAFDADRGAVLARAGAQGIRRFLIAGVSYSHWSRQSRVAATHPGMFCSVGLHPVYLSQLNEAAVLEQLSGIESLLRSRGKANTAPVAIGETGLDRVQASKSTVPLQLMSLRRHLEWATRFELPIVLHCVRAHGLLLDVLSDYKDSLHGGMVHSFSGSVEVMRRYVDLGMYISLSPSVLRLRSDRFQTLVSGMPWQRFLLESDAPDQPIGGRGRGEPTCILTVAERISEIRGCTKDEILRQSSENCAELFGAFQPPAV